MDYGSIADHLKINNMIRTTVFTWIIAIFGATTFLPLLVAQFIMLLKPHDVKSRDLIIGKGMDWRDQNTFSC